MNETLKKYNITAKDLAKIFNYSSPEAFYNSALYKQRLKSAADICRIVEECIISKIRE